MHMEEKEVNLSDYLKLFLKYKYLVIILLILGCSVGYLLYSNEIPEYTSRAYLVVGEDEAVTQYDIGQVRKTNAIVTMAQSYPFVYQVVKDLDLINKPVPLTLQEKLTYDKVNSTKNFDLRELTFYYMRKIGVGSRSGIITVSAISQKPRIAADIANEIANRIVEENNKEKEQVLKQSTAYIESQLNSVGGLLHENRIEKEEAESSESYQEIMELQESIKLEQSLLNMFKREQEAMRTQLALTAAEIEVEDDSNYKEELREKEDLLNLRLEYAIDRVEELTESIQENKKRLLQVDRSELYKIKDIEFAIKTDESIYSSLLKQKQEIALATIVNTRDIKFLSRAYIPVRPNKLKGIIFILASIGIGLAIAFGIMQVLEIFNKRFKSSQEVEDTLGLKVLGNLPVLSKKDESSIISPKAHPKSDIVESYRTLATNLKFATKGKDIKTIVFTSDNARTGKTTNLANLGIVLSQSKTKVLLIDVDLRKSALHRVFKKDRKPGLTDVLSGKSTLKKAVVKLRDNLYMLPAGHLSYNPQSVLESKNMEDLINECKKEYGFILIDTIPATTYSDVQIISSLADASILVIDKKVSKKDSAKAAKKQLDTSFAKILGSIINRSSKQGGDYYQYYYKK